MLNRVNNNAMAGVPGQGAYRKHDAVPADTGINPVGKLSGHAVAPKSDATPPPEPAAILDVSEEGRNLALQSLEVRHLTPDDPFYSFLTAEMEKMAQRKAANPQSLSEPDTSRKIHTVDANEWSIYRLVQDVVNPKMDPTTANNFTNELSRLIQGTWDNSGNLNGTVEERATNREKGLELANYIAETYIDTPDAKKVFLDKVQDFYNNAVLRDKGYIVIEGPNGTTVEKPRSSDTPLLPGFSKAWDEAVDNLSKAGTVDFDDKATLDALTNESARVYLRNAGDKYADIAAKFEAGELNGVEVFHLIRKSNYEESLRTGKHVTDPSSTSEKSFAEKEREVTAAINRVKNTLDIDAIKEEVQRTIKNILSTFMSYADYEKQIQSWNEPRLGV